MEIKNTHYPGQANYVGPKRGWFGLIHHDILVEWTDDITNRLEFYAAGRKPAHEMPTRLRCLVYLEEDELPPEFGALTRARQELQEVREASGKEWMDAFHVRESAKWAISTALIIRQDALLELIRRYVPDLPWENGALIFPKEE